MKRYITLEDCVLPDGDSCPYFFYNGIDHANCSRDDHRASPDKLFDKCPFKMLNEL